MHAVAAIVSLINLHRIRVRVNWKLVQNFTTLPVEIMYSFVFPTHNSLLQRYFIRLAYKGTRYHGWQVQPNATAIQPLLDEKLGLLLGTAVATTGAGRTDAGVHARCFYAHFELDEPGIADTDKLVHQLNAVLPVDISIQQIIRVTSKAHARFSALSRTYEYHLHSRKDPFLEGYSLFFPRPLSLPPMEKACERLLGEQDFSAFSKSHTDVHTTICRIFSASWSFSEHRMVFTIKANRFLRNMVRSIVGTMLEIGLERMNPDEFTGVIHSHNRSAAGQSVAASGLYLTDIEYPPDIYEKLV